jgi:hypothetical protein
VAVFGDLLVNRYAGNLAASSRGLYFAGQSTGQGVPLWFLPSGASTPAQVTTFSREPSIFGSAVSPDGRWLLFSALERTAGDILSVPGFR